MRRTAMGVVACTCALGLGPGLGVGVGVGASAGAAQRTDSAHSGAIVAQVSPLHWYHRPVVARRHTELRLHLWWKGSPRLRLGLRNPTGRWVEWATPGAGNVERIDRVLLRGGHWLVAVTSPSGNAKFHLRIRRANSSVSGGAPSPSPTPTPTPTPTPSPTPTGGGPAPWADYNSQAFLADEEVGNKSYSMAEAVAQARKFSVISAESDTYAGYVDAMKQANPNLLLVAYMNGTMATPAEASQFPPSWFLHDASGHRITNAWHLFLMDPTNRGWMGNRIEVCRQLIAESGYDGCFLDNLGTGTIASNMVSGVPIDPATGHRYTAADWLAATTAIANALEHQAGGIVLSNGLVDGPSYFGTPPSEPLSAVSDLALAEGFLRTGREGISDYPTVEQWKKNVQMLQDAAAHGRRVCMLTKVWVNASQQAKDQWHDFALASFLLGSDGRQCFEFSYQPGGDEEDGDARLAGLTPMGAPAGSVEASGDVYERPFAHGLVLVNPTSQAKSFSLPAGVWENSADGTVVGPSVQLPAHSGLMLFRET